MPPRGSTYTGARGGHTLAPRGGAPAGCKQGAPASWGWKLLAVPGASHPGWAAVPRRAQGIIRLGRCSSLGTNLGSALGSAALPSGQTSGRGRCSLGTELQALRLPTPGYTGELPPLAAQRLSGVPLWCFHSADDVVFSVANSDRLVATLRRAGGDAGGDAVRYTRFERDPVSKQKQGGLSAGFPQRRSTPQARPASASLSQPRPVSRHRRAGPGPLIPGMFST